MWLLLVACHPGRIAVGDSDDGLPSDTDPVADTDEVADTDVDTDTDTDTDTQPPEPTAALVFDGDRPRNVLIVSLDTTRRDQVGLYSGLDTTPNLDAFFAEGVVLDDHRSCANWTAPSMLCALTGRSPLDDDYWTSGVHDAERDPRVDGIPTGLPTLATLLRDQGYATGVISSNWVFSSDNSAAIVEGYEVQQATGWAGAPDTAARVPGLVEGLAASGDPWLVHVHFIDPHGPYVAPVEYSYELDGIEPGYQFPWDVTDSYQVYDLMAQWSSLTPEEQVVAREYLFAVYHGEMRYWDELFGAMMARLESEGRLDDTLVVFFADHGEQFGEHQEFQHGKGLFSEENRVPAAFWAKNLRPARWEGGTQHQDLAPTILDALDLEPSPEHRGTVVGLAPDDRARFSFCYLLGYCDPAMSATVGPYQMIYRWDGKKYFYDLAADPDTSDDIFDRDDPRVKEVWSVLQPEVMGVYERWPFMVPVNAAP